MQTLFPMVKIITLGTSYYAYDAQSSMISNIGLDEIDAIHEFGLDNTRSIPQHLKELFDSGIFIPGPLKKITPNEKELLDIIDSILIYPKIVYN